jgi:hypothetical protein
LAKRLAFEIHHAMATETSLSFRFEPKWPRTARTSTPTHQTVCLVTRSLSTSVTFSTRTVRQ